MEQGRFAGSLQELGIQLDDRAGAEILVEESLATSRIEGERLDRKLVRSSVARRLGLSHAGLPAPGPREDGLVAMLLDATKGCDVALDAARLQGWQAALFPLGYSGLRRVRTGAWRTTDPMRVVSGPVGRERVHFQAPPSIRLARS